MQRKIIITVDTEGDDLWHYKDGDIVKTNNVLFIPRFQELCEEFAFKPVYLTNYEIICDDRFVNYIRPKVANRLCEVGIHIHAWNNPPYYHLERKYKGNPYLIEYPYDIMRQKFNVTYELIKNKIGTPPISHRAGRWAMNELYFQILHDFNIKVDCSYTPGISWESQQGATVMKGPNYKKVPEVPHFINQILEVPVTVKKLHLLLGNNAKSIISNIIKGRNLWFRPATISITEMKLLLRVLEKERINDYVQLMIHSSELMPGGSPYFPDEKSIDDLYDNLRLLFDEFKNDHYNGMTLGEYHKHYIQQ